MSRLFKRVRHVLYELKEAYKVIWYLYRDREK